MQQLVSGCWVYVDGDGILKAFRRTMPYAYKALSSECETLGKGSETVDFGFGQELHEEPEELTSSLEPTAIAR